MNREKNNIKKLVIIAIIKGIIHALIVPISLMFIMLYLTNNLWAFLTPFPYWLFVTYVYITSKDKDISKIAFFRTLEFTLTGIMMYLMVFIS